MTNDIFNEIIVLICKGLEQILNPAIIILGLAELAIMFMAITYMKVVHMKIKALNKPAKKKSKITYVPGGSYQEKSTSYDLKHWDDYKDVLNYYNKKSKLYILYSLFIQLFPLLGILGTVSGLFIALQSGELAGDNLYIAVGFALSSTVLGIVLAVIFKFIDAIFLCPLIANIDGECEIYEKSHKVFENILFHETQDVESDKEQGVE